jgi:hypothetical protein
MDIRPQDLGPKWQIALLQRRSYLSNGVNKASQSEHSVSPRIGMMGRWWTRSLGLSPAAVEATLSGFRQSGSGALAVAICVVMEAGTVYIAESIGQGGHLFAALATTIVGTGLAGIWPMLPRTQTLGIVRKPVTDDELLALKEAAQDPLEWRFFGLVQEIRQQAWAPDATPELRGAVHALGQALSQLPQSVTVANAGALRETAAQKQAEADSEADDVVAASLVRQAAALLRSTDMAERSARLQRRTHALRDELSAQIESLRLGLTNFQSSAGDVSSLSDLAEAVQTVAVQAASLADARAELDNALAGRLIAAANPSAVPQILRAGGS